MSALRRAVLAVFRRVIRVYFREIEIVGSPAPDARGRIFGANHVNGIVDPLVVLTSVACDVAPVAKSTLWKVPGLRWLLDVADAVPVARKKDDPSLPAGSNDEVFDRVAAHLAAGGNILIFPEGTSHNEPRLQGLKTGAGRMLARSRERGAEGLTFQAVGLEFDARDEFRSRALVVFGPVRSVDELARTSADLPHAITDVLRDDLSELMVEGESWSERVLIARVAELLAHEAGATSLAEQNAIGRRVEAARKALSEERALYDDVDAAVTSYYALVESSGLSDDRVRSGGGPVGTAHPIILALLAPLALVGTVLYAIPYRFPRLARLFAKGETDVVSTYKLGIGLVAFPLWALGLATASLLALPFPWSCVALVVALVSPPAALPWLDRFDRSRLARRRGTSGAVPTRDALLAARATALSAVARARELAERRGAA